MPSLRAAVAAVLVLTLVLLPTPGGALPDDGAPAPGAPSEALPPFPGVPGVDLAELGYDGPELLAVDLTVAADPSSLSDDLFVRAQQAGARVELLVDQREGLQQAWDLLHAVVEELNPQVARHRRAEALAAERLEAVTDRSRSVTRRIRGERAALETHQQRMVDAAIAAYIRPPDADTVGAVLDTGPTSTAQLAAPVLHEAKFEHDVDLEDRHEVSLATLQSRRLVLERTERTVERHWQAARARLTTLVERRDAHAEARHRTRLALTEVERRVELWRGVLDEVVGELALVDHSIVASAHATGTDVPVVIVEGIRIHAALAPRLEALITAARADGIVLRGWGHRSHQSQIALRRAHCGPTPEDIWMKPPGQCSPPTAIPGTSMHEIGLAVDFTHAGAAISTRESPAFQWLAAHAADYGFFNLPSEPWHWSVNGR